jgi:hypothetical protein
VKKRVTHIFLLLFIFVPFLSATPAEIPQNAPSYESGTAKAEFTLFLLIKGGLVKKPDLPDFAYRQLKVYPLKVKEFLKNSKYLDYSAAEFKLKAEELISNMTENGKKNAVLVANEVFNYVNLSITPSDESNAAGLTQSDCHALPLDVMKTAKGGSIEKTRLAVALLRYFNIPSRAAFWDDHYVAQYFLKPLESEKKDPAWYIMDFTGIYGRMPDNIEPVAWHPVKAQELLGENWENENISLAVKQVKNTRMEINEAEALALFTNLERGNAYDMEGNTGLSRYYLLKEITYLMEVPDKEKNLKLEFTLPFNESQPFKTLRYNIKPEGNLKAKLRNTHTMTNPPNTGIIYTLPVEFELIGK